MNQHTHTEGGGFTKIKIWKKIVYFTLSLIPILVEYNADSQISNYLDHSNLQYMQLKTYSTKKVFEYEYYFT